MVVVERSGTALFDLRAPVSSEVRPWGKFSVYLLNGHLSRESALRFVDALVRRYEEDVNPGDLRRYAETLFAKIGSKAPTSVKIITVHPDSRLSLQYHKKRAEEWFCLSGEAIATLGKNQERNVLPAGKAVSVPVRGLHRLESVKGAEVLEVATGDFDEKDVVRVEDDYGRIKF